MGDCYLARRRCGGNRETLSSPCTIDAERLHGRTKSGDKRLIAYPRSQTVFTARGDYRHMKVPGVEVLAKRTAMLRRRFLGKRAKCTKRDIDSVSMRVNMHPEATIITNADHVWGKLELDDNPLFSTLRYLLVGVVLLAVFR